MNLLLLSIRSFLEGAGVWAIVGAILPGSLAFNETIRVTKSVSCNLLLMILVMSSGIY